METPRVCLQWHFQRHERVGLSVGDTIPWVGLLDFIKEENRLNTRICSPVTSLLKLQPPCLASPCRLYLQTGSQNESFLKLLLMAGYCVTAMRKETSTTLNLIKLLFLSQEIVNSLKKSHVRTKPEYSFLTLIGEKGGCILVTFILLF